MPVSPQDFALWSRMTGNPVPFDPAQRMAIAPQVYQFNQQLAQGRNPLQQAADAVGSTISSVGKAALGLGLLTGAGLLASKGYKTYSERKAAEEPAATQTSEEAAEAARPKHIWEVQTSAPAPEVSVARSIAAPVEKEVVVAAEPVEVVELQTSAPEVQEEPASVRFAREKARGLSRAMTLAGQEEKQAAARSRVMKAPSNEPLLSGEASPALVNELLGRQTLVAIPQTQTVVPTAESSSGFVIPGYSGKLMLDDEPQVDNDIIASNPLSNTALASQDITSADPASAIGQRISTNQTGAAAEVRAMAETPATVASKLASQQSPVHVKQEGTELVGAPAAGAAEAFRKGRQYQAMKEQYSALRDIASPTTEGVSSAEILSAVPTKARVAVVTAPSQQPAGLVTPGVRRTADQDEQELMMRKYAAVKPRAAATPSGAEFLKTKVAEGLPQATQRGTIEHAVAEAMEQREGMKTLPAGATAYDLPGSSVSRVVMYPNQQVGITYAADPGSEYGAKSTPEFYGELESILKSGEFGRGGKHSAGGFIQAGKNLGLLY